MQISLAENKFSARIREVKKILKHGESAATKSDKNIGHFLHLGFIIWDVHHFLSQLRDLKHKVEITRVQNSLPTNMRLMILFMQKARDGIDMNSIAYLKSTHTYRSYSCPHGLGGYHHEDKAWCFIMPKYLLFQVSNNLLGYIASIIGPWIDIIGNLGVGNVSLSMTDS